MSWTYRADAELPSWAADWKDRDGDLIDLTTATWSVKLVDVDGATALTKTTNVTGAATSPNVVIAWATGDLNQTPGAYQLHIKATIGGNDRVFSPGKPPVINIVAAPT